tara:strand:- start:60 stop:2294 length:2235 start_codon:yes stop_codon:yes gene_type:complete
MAQGGRIEFKHGGSTLKEFIDDKISKGEATFETKIDLIKEWGGKKGGNNYETINTYEDKITFKRTTRLGGDEALKNEKILEFFNNQESGSKINVKRAVEDINKNLPKDQKISGSIVYNRLKDNKFNTKFLAARTPDQYYGQLSDAMKQNIIDTFGDELGITMEDFTKKGKYGVKFTTDPNKYQSIKRFVEGGKWDIAYSVGAADGWILESYKRAGYKPIKEVIRGVEKTIGYEAPDGTKWYAAKKYSTKYNGKQVKELHPSWERINRLVNIVGETRVAPSQAITDLLAKGGVKNINGITLESLTGYLLNNDVDIKNIKKGLTTFPKHHVKGVKISPDADIQLVTRVANDEARRVVNEVKKLKKNNKSIDYDALDERLKKYDVAVEIDGKRLGGTGFESKADIEKFVTKNIKNWKTADFEKLAKQFIKNDVKFASFPANIGAMWKTLGSGARKTLGWGTFMLSELAFAGLDMKNELSKGKTTEEAASIAKRNATFGAYSDDAYLKELIKVADDMDIDTRAFNKVFALNERMSKVGKQQEHYQAKIDKLKTMGPEGIERATKMQEVYDNWQSGIDVENEKLFEDIAGQVSISKAGKVFPSPNLDQIAESRYTLTQKEFEKAFTGVKEAGIEKLKREKTKAFDVQSKQVDTEAGSIGDPLIDFGFNLPAWHYKKILGLEKSPHLEERRHIKEMLDFDPKELYRYNIARGVDPDNPMTQESFQNLIYEQPGLGFSGAEGGIASLKIKW